MSTSTTIRSAVSAVLTFIMLLLALPAYADTASIGAATPVTIDPLYQKALAQVTQTQGAVAAQGIEAQRTTLLNAIDAATKAGDKTAAHDKKVELRSFQVDTIVAALGASVPAETIAANDKAWNAAQTQIAAAQAAGKNVVQSKQLSTQAMDQLTQAKAASDAHTALEQALLAGNSLQIITLLIGTTNASPTPTPNPVPSPTPMPAGLWSTIETPRPWDYSPTQASQSSCGGAGTVYNVGEGLLYSKLSQVPWLKLLPCDTVNIRWQPTPYNESVQLSNRGAANKFIRIVGVPGPNGEQPVIDGSEGKASPSFSFINPVLDGLGLFVVTPPVGYTWGYKPGYIEISNLELRGANMKNNYTNQAGTATKWGKFASGIYIERAENIVISNCHIHDNGNGIFQNSKFGEQGQSRYLLIEGNNIHDNGNLGSPSEHNSYTEGVGTVYQFNRFGPLAPGAYGDSIKDRSAGITIRYNEIDGGWTMINLPDPQSNGAYEQTQLDAWGQPLVKSAYVYGNLLRMRDHPGQGFIAPIPFSFSDGNVSYGNIRNGKVYFYNNTIVSEYDYEYWHYRALPLFLINYVTAGDTTVYARNNVFQAASKTPGAKPAPFSIFMHYGNADFANNWLSGGWLPIDPWPHTLAALAYQGTPWNGSGMGGIVSNAANNPGFADVAKGSFVPAFGSPLANAGTALDPEIVKTGNLPLYEYAGPGVIKPRKQDAAIDIGAFEQ